MQVEPEVVCLGFELRDYLKDEIQKRIDHLEKYFDNIISCRVKVEMEPKHRKAKDVYSVSIELGVPNARLFVNHQPSDDLRVAVREAFGSIRRELEDYVRKQRGDVKVHEPQPHGKVIRLVADEDYGFLESEVGDDVYFHRNSVLDGGFDDLEIGSPVRYQAEVGEKGLQATTVHLIR